MIFKKYFYCVRIVALNEYADSGIDAINNGTVLDARMQLEGYINSRGIAAATNGEQNNIKDCKDAMVDGNLCDDGKQSRIQLWIDKLQEDSKATKYIGQSVNAFHFPEFIEKLSKKAYEFPL